jgi:osmotically-inducible protein OsmY
MSQPHRTDAETPDLEAPRHGALGHLSADEELQQMVCAALIDATELDSSNVGVRASNGTVTLSGSVRDRSAWRLALQVAARQAGVNAVASEELRISAG